MDRGGVISDGVLPGEEEAWDGLKERKERDEPEPARLVQVKPVSVKLDPSGWFSAHLRGPRYRRSRGDGLRHEVVIVPRRTCRYIRVRASCPGVCTPTSDHGLLWLP